MFRCYASFILLLSFFCFQNAQGAEQSEKMPTNLSIHIISFDYPPFIHKTPVSNHKGMEVEIMEVALKGLPVDLKYDFFPIIRAVESFKESSTTSPAIYVGTSLHFKKEIEKSEYTAIRIGKAVFVAYVKKSSSLAGKSIVTMADLKSATVAAPLGSSVVAALKGAGIEPNQVATFEQLFKMVDAGRVDASVVLDIAGDEYLSLHSSEITNQVVKMPSEIYEIPLDIVIANNHPQFKILHSHLTTRLAEMRKNGELKAIAQYYYGKNPVPLKFINPD